ncbi:MAG: hypothetical protein M3Y79_14270 [Pseudomonadota bacterium]|nr:hypothetical protein [Pseudomonadota bacterium]
MLVLSSGVSWAAGEKCTGLENVGVPEAKASPEQKAAKKKYWRTVQETPPDGVKCSSLRTVLTELFNGTRDGGRRLEELAAPELETGRKELEKARATPEVQAELEKLRAAVPDPELLPIYEAAVLDDAGFFAARKYLIATAGKTEGAAP